MRPMFCKITGLLKEMAFSPIQIAIWSSKILERRRQEVGPHDLMLSLLDSVGR